MTDDELKAIEARANTPPFTADNDVANSDVLTLVAEVRRQAAELREWREWVNDMFGARIDEDDPDVSNTDEALRSLASAIINE
jgi:hypothetical protein